MLKISKNINISKSELIFNAIRAQGPGGQNVNKTSSAIHLQFNIKKSCNLPKDVKYRLLKIPNKKISKNGIITIKSQESRSQETNKAIALERLKELILSASDRPTKRIETKPPKKCKEMRLKNKLFKSATKQLRSKSKLRNHND
tara:strand:- start:24 stop:455 length:432 start_codon:yes stop_codon:yes gene_type:complete